MKNFLLFILFVSNIYAQQEIYEYVQPDLDSLKKAIQKLPAEKALFVYAESFEKYDNLYLNDSLLTDFLSKARLSDQKELRAISSYYKALNDINKGKYQTAENQLSRLITYFESLDNKHFSFLTTLQRARINDLKENNKEALKLYKKALSRAKDKKEQFLANYQLGIYYLKISNYDESTRYLNKAFEIAEKLNNEIYKAKVMYRLANINVNIKKTDEACQTLNRAINIFEKYNFAGKDLANAYFVKANCYKQKKEYLQAEKFYKKSLYYYSRFENKMGIAYVYSALGYLQIFSKHYSEANKLLDSSVYILQHLQNNYYLPTVYARKVYVYLYQDKMDSAIYYQQKALDLAVEQKLYDKAYAYYNNIAYLYHKKGDYDKVYDYMENSLKYKDSFLSEKYFNNLNELQTKYETRQKEAEILKLSNENLKKEAELNKTKNIIFWVSLVFLLGMASGFFYWYRRKQQIKLQLLETNFKATEEEKKRIGKELHDGIAGSLIRLVHEVENKDMELSDKLLKTYNEIRDLSHRLNNTTMHDEDLYDRLLEIIPEDKENQRFILKIFPPDLKLQEPYATHVFRIVQELITNNLKHAKASLTRMEIKRANNVLHLFYHDNGSGINELKKGVGLRNIEDRVALMKGKIKYDLNKGFGLQIDIPY